MTGLSVSIATYKHRRTLEHTLQSLRGQSLPGGRYELRVVEDGSIDGTPYMLEAPESWERRGEVCWYGRWVGRRHPHNHILDPAERHKKTFARFYFDARESRPERCRQRVCFRGQGSRHDGNRRARTWAFPGDGWRIPAPAVEHGECQGGIRTPVYAIHAPVGGDVTRKDDRWTRSPPDHYMKTDTNRLP
jgi:cellulose synthase/poly-beta-1,6-N-acetylglucosamine synthase-like glycosyltransferase